LPQDAQRYMARVRSDDVARLFAPAFVGQAPAEGAR
jgi:hypothetical protein